jgi:hypothetical protein
MIYSVSVIVNSNLTAKDSVVNYVYGG